MWNIESSTPYEIVLSRPVDDGNEVEFVIVYGHDSGDGGWSVYNFYFDIYDIDELDYEIDMENTDNSAYEIVVDAVIENTYYFITIEECEDCKFKNLALSRAEEHTGMDLSGEYRLLHISDYRDWFVETYQFDNHDSVDLLDALIDVCRRKGDEGDDMFREIMKSVLLEDDYVLLKKMDLIF
jgi:hypothetical protein